VSDATIPPKIISSHALMKNAGPAATIFTKLSTELTPFPPLCGHALSLLTKAEGPWTAGLWHLFRRTTGAELGR